ncbi:hypothetical protein AB0451_39405 [Streptomyces sp. NPDC052000]|uniref:hypothetical protein n=1 Tax=Streptomyces sp. NPDC052000 TaxID=3155676 RepID=UPI00344FD629
MAPQPFTVQPQNGPTAGTAVATVDASGNETVNGTLTVSGAVILPKMAQAPAGVPLSLVLYTDDGTTLKFVGAGGLAGGAGGTPVLTNGGTLSGTFTATGAVFTGAPDFRAAAASTNVITTDVTADTVPRLQITADGSLKWGGGSGAADCVIDRYAAGGLEINCAFRFTNGQLLFGPAGDVDLYWGGTGLLKTDNNLTVGGTTGVTISTAGGGLLVKTGTNATMGTAVLNGTTAVVVNTTKVTASSNIILTIQTPGGTVASPYVSARTAGTSFSVKSTGASDTSTVSWLIVEPAP